jgi:hypothetical protein
MCGVLPPPGRRRAGARRARVTAAEVGEPGSYALVT